MLTLLPMHALLREGCRLKVEHPTRRLVSIKVAGTTQHRSAHKTLVFHLPASWAFGVGVRVEVGIRVRVGVGVEWNWR